MSEPKIKREINIESESPASPRDSDNDSDSLAVEGPTPNSCNAANRPSLSTKLSKLCAGKSRAQQIRILEEISRHGDEFFDNVKQILLEYSPEIPACQARVDEINKIRSRVNHCQVRVGFIGQTGAGKSSLINGLLMDSILPYSDEQASTAVAVEISYNNDDDPAKRYRAEVEGITIEEFRGELENLFQDKKDWESEPNGEDDEQDLEIWQRIQNTMSKIQCLYPEINELKDLENESVDSLLKHDCCRLLGRKKYWSCGSSEKFSKYIKGFIDTSKSKDGTATEFSVWPLVKVVKLYTRSRILKNNIMLVDLPGSYDTSAARCMVAENYRKNLTLTCVVTPAVRAASDKNAHDLINSLTRTNMQLDGLFSSDSLFFVVTKIDDLMDVGSYIRDHTNLQDKVVEDLKRVISNKNEIAGLERSQNSIFKRYDKNAKNVQKMEGTLSKLELRVEKLATSLQGIGQKRKRDSDEVAEPDPAKVSEHQMLVQNLESARQLLAERKAVIQADLTELYSMNRRLKILEEDLENAECRMRKTCIQNRNQVHIQAANKEYENGLRQLGENASPGPLKVFCVSASVFSLLCQGETKPALHKGFNSKDETGIPSLRDAIMSSTWGIRERNARAFNADVESSFLRMQLWSEDTSKEYHMAAEERTKLESRFEAHFKTLEQKISELHSRTTNNVEELMKTRIYSKLPKLAREAATAAKNIVKKWAQRPMVWNTHRAINRCSGVWKSSKGIQYNWNHELIQNYKGIITKDWYNTFFKQLNQEQKFYEAQVEEIVNEFATSFIASADDISERLSESLVLLKENVLNTKILLKENVSTLFNKIQEESKNSHRLIDAKVVDTWAEVFEKCSEERGRGHYKRNQDTHREHVNGAGGLQMYWEACASIEASLRECSGELAENFDESFNEAVDQIQEDLTVMLERHTPKGTKISSRKGINRTKVKLYNALKPHFEALEQAWGIEPPPIVEEEAQIEVAEQPEEELPDPQTPANDIFDEIDEFLSQHVEGEA